MFSVLLSNEASIRNYQFFTLEEACTYAYQHKKEFCNINIGQYPDDWRHRLVAMT